MPICQLAAITGRFAWARDGSCWAFTHVPPLPYNPAAPAQQEESLDRLLAVAATIPGEFAAWGLCQPWPDDELAAHMAAAHTGDRWLTQVAATMESLPPWEVRFRRAYYLAVRLEGVRHKANLRVDERAAVPPPRLVAAAHEKASIIDRRLAQLAGRPATPAEIAWIVQRVVTRGSVDVPVGLAGEVLCGDKLAELADCEVVNGGPDRDDGPVFGRWARVDCHHGRGFQAIVAVEQGPSAFDAPGGPGEWFARVERLNLPVDWFFAGVVEHNVKAQKAVRSKLRMIDDEHQSNSHDTAGVRPAMVDAYEALKHKEGQLAATGQHALIFTSLFTVGATTVDELEQRVAAIEDCFAADDYQLTRRLGRQKALLFAQLPCHRFRRSSPLWRFRQYTMPAGFAGAAPFCGSVGGDPTGLMLAVDAGTGVRTPLFFDPGYAARINQSPSFIICGELGSGKSLTAKRIAVEGYIPAGGQVFALDFTQSQLLDDGDRVGEWVHLASALDCTTAVIDIDRGRWSIDPCTFNIPSEDKRRMLAPGLMVACNYNDDTKEADLIAKAVEHVVAGACGGRAAGVIRWLAEEDGGPMALEVVDRLNNARVYMPALFDETREPPDLDAQYIVFAGPNLRFPSWEELTNPELAVKVTRDKRAGQALLTLVADICLWRGKTTNVPTLVVMDEFWRIMATPRGGQIVDEMTTEGRRYDLALGAIIQNAGLLSSSVRSFAGQVMVFRCRGDAAAAAAQLVGIDPAQVHALRDIRNVDGTPASGLCYWRDARGRLVLAHVLLPADQRIALAVRTTPTEVHA